MTHVLIATPTTGGVVKAQFAATLAEVVKAVKDAGWEATFVTVDSCYVSTARNYFANMLLNEAKFTHLAMIDSAMFFAGHVVCRLIRSGKPVVAAAYPARQMKEEHPGQ